MSLFSSNKKDEKNPAQNTAQKPVTVASIPTQTTTQKSTETSKPQEKTSNSKTQKAHLTGIDEFFSDQLRRTLIVAAAEAKAAKAEDIDTEYLLLGLLKSNDPVTKKIFEELKINTEELEKTVRDKIKSSKNPPEKLRFSPRSKMILELADRARRKFRHHTTANEHLLLAIVREGDGLAARTMKKMNITPDKISESIINIVGKGKKKDVLKSNKTPILDEFGIDLCEKAREGKIDPVIGRSEEIERTSHILARRRKNNPVLVGSPGVGKTAIVEGLANKIAIGDVPESLKGKRIIEISMASLMSGASKRGQFEQRVQGVIKEATESAGEIILFIDEIHTIISSDDSAEVSNMFKPPLARGELHCLGATTPAEYHQYIEKDAALERRFQPVTVPEPSLEETFEIMQGLRDKYEAFHKVKISDEILKMAIKLTDRYINDRFLPDKAVDLIDEAAAVAKMPSLSAPVKIQKLEKEVEHLFGEREQAKKNINVEELTRIEKQLKESKTALDEAKEANEEEKARSHDVMEKGHLLKVVSKWTGVPMEHMSSSETEKLMKLEKVMHERVKGQDEAIKAVAQAVRRGRAGLKKKNLPIGSFLFMGPTGVGKTEVAKTLAVTLFGMESAMIRFDMSEFMEKHTVARLLGPPPGYVGYEAGGELTEAIRKRPFAIVLFDEVEKAHPDVFRIFLQLLDDGRLTDNHGRTVSFKNSIIICTSNLAAQTIADFLTDGIPEEETAKKAKLKELKNKVMPEVLKFFKPEMINRFDEQIFFEPLSKKNIAEIIDIFLSDTRNSLKERKITIQLSDDAKALIADAGFDPQFGARPLRRTLRRLIDDPLSDMLIKGEFVEDDHIVVTVETNSQGNEKLVFAKGVRGMVLESKRKEEQAKEKEQGLASLEDRLLTGTSEETLTNETDEQTVEENLNKESNTTDVITEDDQTTKDNTAVASSQTVVEDDQVTQDNNLTNSDQATQTENNSNQATTNPTIQATKNDTQVTTQTNQAIKEAEDSFEDKIFGELNDFDLAEDEEKK